MGDNQRLAPWLSTQGGQTSSGGNVTGLAMQAICGAFQDFFFWNKIAEDIFLWNNVEDFFCETMPNI